MRGAMSLLKVTGAALLPCSRNTCASAVNNSRQIKRGISFSGWMDWDIATDRLSLGCRDGAVGKYRVHGVHKIMRCDVSATLAEADILVIDAARVKDLTSRRKDRNFRGASCAGQ